MTTAQNEKRQHLNDGDTFDHDGLLFRVGFEFDDSSGLPWEEYDGHGPVIEVRKPHWWREGGKRPGWRPMNRPERNGYQYFYDWQGAIKQAHAEGWGLALKVEKLTAKLGRAPTRRELIAESVRFDFDYLCGWMNDAWNYLVVSVDLMEEGEDGEISQIDGYSRCCGGVESFNDYHQEFAFELAEELAREYRKDRKAEEIRQKRESEEREYWNSRDVMTA